MQFLLQTNIRKDDSYAERHNSGDRTQSGRLPGFKGICFPVPNRTFFGNCKHITPDSASFPGKDEAVLLARHLLAMVDQMFTCDITRNDLNEKCDMLIDVCNEEMAALSE